MDFGTDMSCLIVAIECAFDFVKKMEREKLEKLKRKAEKEKAEKEKEAGEKVSLVVTFSRDSLLQCVSNLFCFFYAFMHGVAWCNGLCEFRIGIMNMGFHPFPS